MLNEEKETGIADCVTAHAIPTANRDSTHRTNTRFTYVEHYTTLPRN